MRDNAKISLIETKTYITNISDELIQSFKDVINGDWGLDKSTDIKNVFLIDIEIPVEIYQFDANASDDLFDKFSNSFKCQSNLELKKISQLKEQVN